MSRSRRGEVDASGEQKKKTKSDNLIKYAPVAESVDALDLKSNRGQPSVPVQVWPRANNNKQYSLSLRRAFLLLKFLCVFPVRLTELFLC